MRGVLAVLGALAGMMACAVVAQGRPDAAFWRLPAYIAASAVPAGNPMDAGPVGAARIALGRRLFHDADLSMDGTMSCATCHDPAKSFADSVRARPGVHGDPGLRNAPSLLNVAWLTPLTWGNAQLTTLEEQALVPITGDDPVEMGMKGQEAELARRLSASRCYRNLFRKAFPATKGRMDFASVALALAAFQRTIVSYDTTWDRARQGGDPLGEDARRGERAFGAVCASCHAGPHFTDMRFHRLGSNAAETIDRGLARVTLRDEDAGLFRTPSLRNASLTAPYLHDGSAATLTDAIDRHGIALTPAERTDILTFLDTLTDNTVASNPRFVLPGARCETEG